jgi:hypothetical protein
VLNTTGSFSVSYGVIADIASPAERGSFVGAVAFGYVYFNAEMLIYLITPLQYQYGT